MKSDYEINKELYGELLYEFTDAKTIYDPPENFKRGIGRKILSAYLLVFAAGFIGWYLYSLISHSLSNGFTDTLMSENQLAYFFMLVVFECIILFSVFGAWGKFIRFAMRRNLVDRRDAEVRRLEAEVERADDNKYNENALYIYDSHVVLKSNGAESVFERTKISKVSAKKSGGSGLELKFSTEVDDKIFTITVPYSDLIELRGIFANLLTEESVTEDDSGKPDIKTFFIFGFVILVGIALIVLHFTVLTDMPLIFGIFFAAVGAILFLAQFDRYALVKNGLIPLFFGLLFSGLPIDLIFLLAKLQGEELTFAYFFGTFNYNAAFVFLLSFSLPFICVGIVGIVKCIRHHRK